MNTMQGNVNESTILKIMKCDITDTDVRDVVSRKTCTIGHGKKSRQDCLLNTMEWRRDHNISPMDNSRMVSPNNIFILAAEFV